MRLHCARKELTLIGLYNTKMGDTVSNSEVLEEIKAGLNEVLKELNEKADEKEEGDEVLQRG